MILDQLMDVRPENGQGHIDVGQLRAGLPFRPSLGFRLIRWVDRAEGDLQDVVRSREESAKTADAGGTMASVQLDHATVQVLGDHNNVLKVKNSRFVLNEVTAD